MVSQRHKFGCAFFRILLCSKKFPCFCFVFLFNFRVSNARPEKLFDFYRLQRRIMCQSDWIAQAEKRYLYCVNKGGKSKLTA